MTYVMSDLHGCYDLYLDMLDKIRFDEDDTLYILGDYVDRGERGFDILFDIAKRKNVVALMGNHDYVAYDMLSRLNSGITAGEMAKIKDYFDNWLYENGGDVTLNAFRRLSPQKRKEALSIMQGLLPYAECEAGGKRFVMCHAGIKNHKSNMPLSEHKITDFLFGRTNYFIPVFEDKYLITGHTPTAIISSEASGKIYKNNTHIAIDCGAVFGLGFGCICLDNMREYYVK